MSPDVDALVKVVLSARRRRFFRRTPVFNHVASTSVAELAKVEEAIGHPLPKDFRTWLLLAGYGDFDDELSIRREWLATNEHGLLKWSIRFGQDILGNNYAFDVRERVLFLPRTEAAFAVMSSGFLEFIKELIRRDYRILDWVETLETQSREWA